MKLSSLASGIGFAELTYQVRQIESYNAHALEAFAVGTALYLALGVVMGMALARLGPGKRSTGAHSMNANLAVIADNLDYLLWGRLADGIPGGVALTLMMAIGAAALALPRHSAGRRRLALWRAGAPTAVPVGGADSRHPAYFRHFLAVVSAADADRERPAGRGDRHPGAGVVYRRLGDALGAGGAAVIVRRTV
jgi:hypothetical protein